MESCPQGWWLAPGSSDLLHLDKASFSFKKRSSGIEIQILTAGSPLEPKGIKFSEIGVKFKEWKWDAGTSATTGNFLFVDKNAQELEFWYGMWEALDNFHKDSLQPQHLDNFSGICDPAWCSGPLLGGDLFYLGRFIGSFLKIGPSPSNFLTAEPSTKPVHITNEWWPHT